MADPVGPPLQSQGQAPVSQVTRKPRTRVVEIIIVLLIIGAIVGAAFFGENISAFFRLHLWDSRAASRTVEEFMTAVQKGDEQKAQSYLAAPEMKPITDNG